MFKCKLSHEYFPVNQNNVVLKLITVRIAMKVNMCDVNLVDCSSSCAPDAREVCIALVSD